MKKYNKNLLIAAVSGAVMIALPALANHTWGNASGTYHWDANSLPVQLSVIDSVTPDWQTELDTTISQWNVSSSLNLTISSSDDSSSTRSNCAVANGQIRACNSAYGNTGWSGLASLNIDSNNHILYGVAKVNDTYSMSQEDRNKVMCQEVGHLFGLGHTSEDGSSQNTCMDYATNPVNSQWPNAHDYELLDQIYSHIGGGGGGGGGGSNVLENGVTVSGLAESTGNDVVYTMDVPSGATNISFDMSGGTGDADMYVKFGSTPTDSSYDCRPYKSGNSETCSGSQTNGTYYVRVKAYSTFSGTSLTGSYTEAGGGGGGTACVSGNGVLCNGVEESNMSGARRSQTYFYIDIPAGASNLSFKMSGGSGDADMYVKYGSKPTTGSYDCRPYKGGNNETCNVSSTEGRHHVMIRGYSSYSGANLTVTYTGGAASAAHSSTNAKHYTRGIKIESSKHHELWMTKNADGTITMTQVILATKEQIHNAAHQELVIIPS